MNTRAFINDNKSHEKYKKIIKKYGLMSVGMFSRRLVKMAKEKATSNGKTPIGQDAIELKNMYSNLNRIEFFDKLINMHNEKYKIFNTKEMEKNPFLVDRDTMEAQYIHIKDNKPIEILAKKIQLENRFSKLCRYGRNEVIAETAKRESKDEFAKLFMNTIYKNMLIQGKMEEFLEDGFKHYYEKKFTEEEFENLETIKMCKELIKETKKENKISVKEAYMFSVYENTNNYLLKNKAKDITRMLDIYLGEKKIGAPSFDIGVRYDSKVLGANSMGISINIPNYVCPFKVHCSKELIDDAEEKHKIEVPKSCRQNSVEATIPHKITNEQINKIRELMRLGSTFFKDKRIFSNEIRGDISQYLTNNLGIKKGNIKKEIKEKITEIKENKTELDKINREIKEIKTKNKELKNDINLLKENIEENIERN